MDRAMSSVEKQGTGPKIIGNLVKGFKAGKTNHNMDLSQMSKSNFSHLEGVFMKKPLLPEPSPTITKEVQEPVELDFDDIVIDEPVPVASTSSHNIQTSKRGTERENLLDSEGDDATPRLRTREEIIAKYRKKLGLPHQQLEKQETSFYNAKKNLRELAKELKSYAMGLKTLLHWQMSLSK